MKNGIPVSWNSPLVNAGPAWQVLHEPLPKKMRKPRLAASGYFADPRLVAFHQRIAEFVERRAPARQRLLERRERLRHVHQHLLVAQRRRAEHFAIAAREFRILAHQFRHLRRARAHLPRVEDRADALRPQAVVRAVPAEPALQPHVGEARRVAVGERDAARARLAVGPVALRQVAARARLLAVGRQPPLEEQPLAELDRVLVPGHAVRGIGPERRRPRPVRTRWHGFRPR